MAKRYWLMKSEPDVYSIDQLEQDGSTSWEGVRNYQARNFMMEMKKGDRVLFYHSNAEPSGVAGVAEVVREAYPDTAAFDPKSDYYDEASTPEKPRWFMVDVGFVEKFPAVLGLPELKADPRFEGMEVVRKGSRLSVHSVTKEHFDSVVKLARRKR